MCCPPRTTREHSRADGTSGFVLFDADTDRPGVYFLNTNTHKGHQHFLNTFGFERGADGLILGMIIYDPELVAPNGNPGIYLLHLTDSRSSDYNLLRHLERPYALLAASVPLLDDNLAFYVPNSKLPYIQSELPLYRESRIGLFFEEDLFAETDFLALNPGEGYGAAAGHGARRASQPQRHRDL